jgi:DMSO/TMAO reductase YedYZ heme-binding membrane subunit
MPAQSLPLLELVMQAHVSTNQSQKALYVIHYRKPFAFLGILYPLTHTHPYGYASLTVSETIEDVNGLTKFM